MPFLSVITVCYNSEKTLRRTLESVLNQGFQDYEYLLIDGASTDGTLALIREYEPRFQGRMRYLSEKDTGIYNAMNKGIRLAKGEWIGIINSDDRYLENAFAHVAETAASPRPQNAFAPATKAAAAETAAAEAAASPEPDVIYSDLDYLNADGKVVRRVTGDVEKLWKGMFVNHPTCFVKRSAYEKYGLFDEGFRIVADYDLMQRIYHQGGTFRKCPHPLAAFYTGGVSDGSFRSELEKYRVQKRYYSPLLCDYLLLRSFCACKLRPALQRLLRKR